MDVDDIRLLFAQQPLKISARIGGPKCSTRQADLPQTSIILDLPVAPLKENYLVSGVLEHLGFLLKDDVLSPGLLIRVMNENYFHKTCSFLFFLSACLAYRRRNWSRRMSRRRLEAGKICRSRTFPVGISVPSTGLSFPPQGPRACGSDTHSVAGCLRAEPQLREQIKSCLLILVNRERMRPCSLIRASGEKPSWRVPSERNLIGGVTVNMQTVGAMAAVLNHMKISS